MCQLKEWLFQSETMTSLHGRYEERSLPQETETLRRRREAVHGKKPGRLYQNLQLPKPPHQSLPGRYDSSATDKRPEALC